MSITVTVQGLQYTLPVSNDLEWGENVTDYLIAVSDALASAVQQGDIAPTTLVYIQNNQPVPTNVTNLVFDSGVSRSVAVDWYVYRVRGSTEVAESGTFRAVYKTNAGEWQLEVQREGDDTGVEFSITPGGQIQYVSSNISTSGTYSGSMRYRARAIIS